MFKLLSIDSENFKIVFPEAEFKEFYPRLKFKTRLKSWLVPLKIVFNF